MTCGLALQGRGWLLVIPLFLTAQEPGKVSAPTPAATQPIHVSCSVQRAYVGPAPQWFPTADSLSDEQIAHLETVLSAHPDDTCTRGYLIAHGNGRASRCIEHLVWMIENHPEWDGFLLGISCAGDGIGQAQRERIRAAWLQRAGSDQRSGAILHNAAVFFAPQEPDYAVALLERAIRLEPGVQFHIEGLGMLYGRAQFVATSSPFAAHAKSALLASTDPVLVAGALNEMANLTMGMSDSREKLLLEKLGELIGNRDVMDVLRDLPSRSGRYTRYECAAIPLLRKCVER